VIVKMDTFAKSYVLGGDKMAFRLRGLRVSSASEKVINVNL
jgi:hypothetical protein